MGTVSSLTDIPGFIREEFGEVQLGDRRLGERLKRIVFDLAKDPSRSLPKACVRWAATKGTYRFCDNPKVSRRDLQMNHFQSTAGRVMECPLVLVVEDTTFLNFSHHPATQGLGKIGDRSNRLHGAALHSALAVEAGTHRTLGLLGQDVILRKDYRPKEESYYQRSKRSRESGKWMTLGREVLGRLGSADRIIFVFDREGDVFEVLSGLRELGARFVIRAKSNRRLKEPGRMLLEEVRQAPVLGSMKLTLPARGGRCGREAALEVRSGSYEVKPPAHLVGQATLRVHALQVKETGAPKGVEALEWILLTSEAVGTLAEAQEVIRHYAGRWKIEEWHKALKTGCRIEDRELETWDRLEVLVGIFSILAWRMLALRDQARSASVEMDPEVLSTSEREVLRRLFPKLGQTPGAREYLRAVAQLGGFLGRKHDGDPGWMTIWQGLAELKAVDLGYRLATGQSCG